MEPQIIDLGSFIPKTFTLKFSINGHPYTFEYGEATVDEVFHLLAQSQDPNEDPIARLRRIVTSFLANRLPEAQRDQFKKDMAQVPYKGEELSIDRLYSEIQQKYQKKGLGAGAPPENPARSG